MAQHPNRPTRTLASDPDARERLLCRLVGRLVGRRRLVAVCVGITVAETLLVGAFLPSSSVALATQGSAPPPFDLFHDLRWIVVYHESWFAFAVELLGGLALRGALLTVLVRAAWPRDIMVEPVTVTARRSVIYVAVVALLLAPWVGLVFALAVVSLSWLFFVAVPVVLMLAVLVAGGAVTGSWWRRTLSWRVVGIVVLTFVAISGFGSVLSTCPSWWRLPVAVVAGVVNAWLWVRLVDAVLHASTTTRRVPVIPTAIAGVFVLVIVGTVAGFALSRHPVTRFVTPAAAVATSWRPSGNDVGAGEPLLVVTGFNTEWDGVPSQSVRLAVPQRRFSYRGMADGHPLPYGRADTHRSLRELARSLGEQVDAYHRETGAPITLVAESEGALLAKAYVAGAPATAVRNLVLVSPLVDPGRVYYPPDGEGWGVFGKLEMEGLSWVLGELSPVDVTPDTPFLRSIVDEAPTLRRLMSCTLPGVRQAAVLPLDTGVSASSPRMTGIPFTVVPAFHGGLLDDAKTAAVVAAVVDGRTVTEHGGWSLTEDVIHAGAAAWQVPPLAVDVNEAWAGEPDRRDCGAVRARLRAWMVAR